jgi:Glycosyltransferase
MGGFAYLFERFPSFTQTFCFREVLEMRRQGVIAPVFSIRTPRDEPEQNFPPELSGLTTYLPESFDGILANDAGFRRRARRALGELRNLWGGESEKRRIYEALWLLPRLRETGVGHVHVHFAGTAARTAFWLKRLGGIRFSVTAHANDIFCDEPRDRLEMMLDAAERVVTVSDFSARWLREELPPQAGKVRRVYNGIAIDRFRRGDVRAGSPGIVGVGRYIEKKGFADLISACAMLPDIEFCCRIIGEGPLRDDLIAKASSDPRVAITGPLSESAIVDELAAATVFALPCVDSADGGKDNLPTVIMEAMAAALPVVSTRLAGIPEMVIDGETGFLVEPGDVAGLAARLRELLVDPARARAMGEAGFARCRELFATERTTGELRGVLGECGAFDVAEKGWFKRLFG